MAEPRYDRKQVALILQRALETEHTAGQGGEGLSLAELKEVASEVGITPAAIEAAVRRLRTEELAGANPLLGTPGTVEVEETVDIPAAESRLPSLVLAIRRIMGRQGIVDSEFGGLSWRARDALGGRYITVKTEGGRTLVRGFANLREGQLGFFFTIPWAGLILSLIVLKKTALGALLGLGWAPLVALVSWLPARWLWKRQFQKEARTLQATVDEVIRTLETEQEETGALPPASG